MESKKGLFLRNLPYNATDEELNEFFSHYGETKACFIIKNNEGKVLKHDYIKIIKIINNHDCSTEVESNQLGTSIISHTF